ncbi:MAG: carboxypeptidase regulatory-like domain-containing protein, partial [Planctomycetota bacterium]
TVAWPAKLKLELLEQAGIPHVAGMPTLGAGSTARFAGSLSGGLGEPISGTVQFIAGPNQGRTLHTNSQGKFGASDLLPGLSVVEIDGAGSLDSRREVRLRAGAETPLNIGFGMPGSASGKVLDREGKPLAGATVELDGQIAFSDLEGNFHLDSIPSGLDLECFASKEGYASYSERVTIAARTPNDHLVFTLLPGASLDVEVPEAIGAPEDAMVILMNANPAAARSFPWRKKNPIAVRPGSRVHIDDLPPGVKVRVVVFHQGALAKPPFDEVTLQEGTPQLAVVHLEPAPLIVGTVHTRDGLVAQSAKLRLEAPDRVGSTVAYFGETAMFLEAEVLPSLPMGLQETVSDHNGHFEFTSYPKQAPRRYLTATSADGLQTGTVIVAPEAETVDVTIYPVGAGSARLSVSFPGRHQALPIECMVRGTPLDPYLLALQDPYVIDGLAPGMWRLTASWNGKEIPVEGATSSGFKLEAETTQVIRLPQGAIDGQDPETLRRARGYKE